MGKVLCSIRLNSDLLEKLKRFAEKAKSKGAKAIVCTEKDKVKLSKNKNLCLPILYVEMDLRIIEGDSHWKKLVEKNCRIVNT